MARLTEFEEDNWLLSEANKRLEKNGEKNTVSLDDVMNHLGISESEIRNVDKGKDEQYCIKQREYDSNEHSCF